VANKADTGMSAINMMAITERTGWSVKISKTIGECCALLLAVMFNGPIGLGTFVITFSIGPLIQFFGTKLKMLEKSYKI